MIIKICGLTWPQDAELAALTGADWLGPKFWPESRRLDNVGAAIEAAAPFGVDAAGGVESAPGRKRAGLVERFVRAARVAAARSGGTP